MLNALKSLKYDHISEFISSRTNDDDDIVDTLSHSAANFREGIICKYNKFK